MDELLCEDLCWACLLTRYKSTISFLHVKASPPGPTDVFEPGFLLLLALCCWSFHLVVRAILSNTELSLLESSRISGTGKRSRDRDALRVAVRVRPLIEREKGSRAVTCDGGKGRLVVVNPIKFKASADAVRSCFISIKGTHSRVNHIGAASHIVVGR